MHKMEVGEKRGTRTTTKQNDAKSTVRLRCKKEGCSISNYFIFFKNTNYASLQRSQIHLKKKYFFFNENRIFTNNFSFFRRLQA